MSVRDIMTADPVCCLPEMDLPQAAKLMSDNDCGAIPVVENERTRKLIGVITDRDIVCRLLAKGIDPLRATVQDAMSTTLVTVTPETTLEACCVLLEENQLRRVMVVDDNHACCGIVSQADLAKKMQTDRAAKALESVSQPAHVVQSP